MVNVIVVQLAESASQACTHTKNLKAAIENDVTYISAFWVDNERDCMLVCICHASKEAYLQKCNAITHVSQSVSQFVQVIWHVTLIQLGDPQHIMPLLLPYAHVNLM